jgi:hypothetical protein
MRRSHTSSGSVTQGGPAEAQGNSLVGTCDSEGEAIARYLCSNHSMSSLFGRLFFWVIIHRECACDVGGYLHVSYRIVCFVFPLLVRSLVDIVPFPASRENSSSLQIGCKTMISKKIDASITRIKQLVVMRYKLRSTECYLSTLSTLYKDTKSTILTHPTFIYPATSTPSTPC